MSIRVLVVDDDRMTLRLLEKHLSDAGYDVMTAANGVEALNILHAEGLPIVITDWMMPEMDGLELCQAIRSDDGIGLVYIIMLTAHSDVSLIAQAFQAGVDDFLSKPFHQQELLARMHGGVRILALEADLKSERRAVHKANAEMAILNQKLQRMAMTDELTGVANRREAMRLLHEHWAIATRHDQPLACIMLDIDHFKRCNDDYGHDVGDAVLRQTAATLNKLVRTGETVFRIGGEEFLVLCLGSTSRMAAQAAERLRRAIESEVIQHGDIELSVTISVGVAERNGSTATPEDLLKRADEALYAAKRRGRNRVCIAHGHSKPDGSGPRTEKPTPVPRTLPARDFTDVPHTILVVDDDPSARALCRKVLQPNGYVVTEAADGVEALEHVRRSLPDVVIMDAVMPNLDGLECTRRLKADPATKEISIIMVSARTGPEDIEAGLEAGVDEYVTRPFRHNDFLLRVRSMVRLNRSRAELIRSNHVRAEEANSLGILLDLSRSLATATTLDTVLERTVSVAAELTRSRRISIMLPDPEGTVLMIAKAIGMDEHAVAEVRVPAGGGIVGQVFLSGDAIVLNTPEEAQQTSNQYDSQFFASVPLVSKALTAADQVVGVLNITERLGGQPYTVAELEYIDLICNMGGSAIGELDARRRSDEARNSIVVALAKLAEHRDNATGKHLERVTRYSLLLARALGSTEHFHSRIDDQFIHDLERSVALHDIGKVAIPDHILLKPGKLTEGESALMKEHSAIGAETIRSVIQRAPGVSFLTMAEEITRAHHEKYDGTGYPRGLRGEAIPLAARITALADVYDALTSRRPYKEAFTHDKGTAMITESSGTHFDPAVVQAFLDQEHEFARLAAELADEAPLSSGMPHSTHSVLAETT